MNPFGEIDWTKPFVLKINNGLPDLTVDVVPAKSLIMVTSSTGTRDSTVVTITVHNRLTLLQPSSPLSLDKAVEAIGSDVTNVTVLIELTSNLQQVGNVSVPQGFTPYVAQPNQQSITIIGGPIPAGASVNFLIEVIWKGTGGPSCGTTETVSAEVDPPPSSISEMSKSNNKGSANIDILIGVC